MATVVAEFPVWNGIQNFPYAGDADGPNAGENVYTSITQLMRVGRAIKNAGESNSFFVFDTEGIPRGSAIEAVELEYEIHSAVLTGEYDIGFLADKLPFSNYKASAFALNGSQSTPFLGYFGSYLFPNDGHYLPHATQDGSDVVEPNILILDSFIGWAGAPASWNAYTPNLIVRIGQGFSPVGGTVIHETSNFTAFFSAWRNTVGETKTGLTLDTRAALNTQTEFFLFSSDGADIFSALPPTLRVRYVEPIPTFPGFDPPLTGAVGALYSFQVVADSGSTDVLPEDDIIMYSLTVAPAGATIDPLSGIITWVPVPGQGGQSHPFTVGATNVGGFTSFESWSVSVPRVLGVPINLGEIQFCPSLDLGIVPLQEIDDLGSVALQETDDLGTVVLEETDDLGTVVLEETVDLGIVTVSDEG